MSAFRIISFFFSFVISTSLYAQTRVIKLEVELLPFLKTILEGSEINLSLVGQYTHEYKVFKNQKYIEFDSLTEKELIINISCNTNIAGFPREYRMMTGVNSFTKDSLQIIHISFPENCDYNKNSISNICPKCVKKDKVIPILYGLRMPIYDRLGNQLNPDPEKYHPGGCIVSNCDPTWHCERDKFSF